MVLKNQLLLAVEECSAPQKKDIDVIFLVNVVLLFVMFQLGVVLRRQSLGPGMPTPQIKMIGVPCPIIEKSMAQSTDNLDQM